MKTTTEEITKDTLSFLRFDIQEEIGVIWLDKPNAEMNTIDLQMVDEFQYVLDKIEENDNIKAAVLISGKNSFMAGADIKQFLEMKEGDAAKAAIAGHKVLRRIEKSQKPFVSAIHGACMGGGTEISLACAGRVATKDRSTVMALPEVKLGLLPGMGGTIRMPRLIGIQKGLDIMLTGKNVYASKAYKIGLVDILADVPKLLMTAKKLACDLANKKFKRKDKRSALEKLLEGNPITRNVIFSKAREMVLKQTQGNYPAPLKIIESVKYNTGQKIEKAMANEVRLFDELMATPQARQLINIFFAMTAMKKNPMKAQVKTVDTIGILGAGLMGEGIAEVSLFKGYDVILKDISADMIRHASKNMFKAVQKKVNRKMLLKAEGEKLQNQLNGTLSYDQLHKADMVIEAVFEDMKLKHTVLADVEKYAKEDTIFATNTSALPISDIAAKAKRPEQVIGMHYFSPVQKMPLLEIIKTDKTSDWVTATALETGIKQGKICIVVKDGPGFYTTRILAPFMNEALLLIEEGADPLFIEKAMKKFGFPVGPITLIDEVGIDVGAHISAGALGKFFEDRGDKGSDVLSRMAAADFKGRKNRNGFLIYDKNGKKVKGKVNQDAMKFFNIKKKAVAFLEEDIQERMSMIMINEAVLCLQEGILDSPRDGDIGAVFGLGFPPFLGGPFRYLDSLGTEHTVKKMQHMAAKWGDRFKPADMLVAYGKDKRLFYEG